jgi:hypothetical protein
MKREMLTTKYPSLSRDLACAIYDTLWVAIIAELFATGKVHVKGIGWLELKKGDKVERYYIREAVAALSVISNNTVTLEPDRELVGEVSGLTGNTRK